MAVPSDIHDAVVALIEQDADPELTDQEVDDAIARVVYYQPWAANTAYAYGVRVGPSVANGWLYRCVVGGLSGSAEPAWPVPYAAHNPWGIGSVTDGTVTWVVAAPVTAQYDVPSAAVECWLMKARKAANRVDVAVQTVGSTRESMTHAQCLAMARALAPVRFA
jgi:hypothetical protein